MEIVQRSFAAGEITPDLQDRPDYVAYQNGLKTLRNAIVRKQTGVMNRPGTKFIGMSKFQNKKIRLLPFEYSFNDSLVIEMGDLYFRFYKNNEIITEPLYTIDSMTSGVNPVITTTGNHDFVIGDEVVLNLFQTIKEFNKVTCIITSVPNLDEFTFDIKYPLQTIDTAGMGTFVSGDVARIFELAHIIPEADLFNVRYTQYGNILTYVHRDYGIFDLKRLADNLWTNAQQLLQPSVRRPSGVVLTKDGTNTGTYSYGYLCTYLDQDGIESYGRYSTIINTNKVGDTVATRITIALNPEGTELPTNLKSIRLYRIEFPFSLPATNQYTDNLGIPDKSLLANFAFVTAIDVGFTFVMGSPVPLSTPFLTIVDRGTFIADFEVKPPIETYVYGSVIKQEWDGTGSYDLDDLHPNAVALSKARFFYGGSNAAIDTFSGSKISQFDNFVKRETNLLATDAVEYSSDSEKVGRIQHLLDFKRLIAFTDLAEIIYKGSDEYGTLSAVDLPNPEKLSNNGISEVRPLVADQTVLFVQARGNSLRSLSFTDKTDNDSNNEISLPSAHLFEDYEIVDWGFQKTQHPIVWIVRNDGILLSLTYLKGQEVKGFARHDTSDGLFESVASIGENVVDTVYLSVFRSGFTGYRSIESFDTFEYKTLLDKKLCDSHILIDGTNLGSTEMELSDITDWNYGSDLTLTSSASYFKTNMVDSYIFLKDSLGVEPVLKLKIKTFTNATTVVVRADRDVPGIFKEIGTTSWAKALVIVPELYHLEGLNVSVLADGKVVSSPLNPAYPTKTVSNSQLNIDEPAVVIQIGIPYVVDFESIGFDQAAKTESLSDKTMLVKYVNVKVKDTAYCFAGTKAPDGDGLGNLFEAKVREYENYDDPLKLKTGLIEVAVNSKYDLGGRIFIRQVDPHPITILSVLPSVTTGF